eukprot:TRINITY_DN1734_c0_g1_i1.p1 TRINITY_DN1734_c0_g1~~TRINITY_DN1734_c0_g1_i1.p1  ORF type:complete len:341 (+),score=41.84 TRINITY_DN1734_c0_g1_i1:326-1348(+)
MSASLFGITSTCLSLGVVGVGWLFWRLFVKGDASVNLFFQSTESLGKQALYGKVIWITGSSQGLGLEIAKKLAKLGANIILSARNLEKLEKARLECQEYASGNNEVKTVQLDLTSSFSDLQLSTKSAVEQFGHVHILIHNAGVTQHALMEETEPNVVEEMFKLNTIGPILLTRAFIPYMIKQQNGHLVVVSSMAAKVPSPGQSVYAGTKSALHGFFNSLQTELADQGVHVSLICPGPVSASSLDTKRTVYGPKGLKTQDQGSQKGKIQLERAVDLIALTVVKQFQEVWICKYPVLTIAYIVQFLPFVGWKILNKYGPARARAMHTGQSGYDVASIMKSSK